MESLIFDNFSLEIGGEKILNDLSARFDIQIPLTIVGESGSGKSMLIKCLTGMQPSNAVLRGNFYIDNKSLMNYNKRDWEGIRGRKIAHMAQNPMAMFNSFQTIRIHFFETLKSHFTLTNKECEDIAKRYLTLVNLPSTENFLNQYPFELSGGMLQRVMLAILLALDPDLFILDEPTSSVDRKNRNDILEQLKQLLSLGKRVILVTHDYGIAQEIGGNLLVLRDGKLIESGKVEELLENPQHPYSQELLLHNPYERLLKDATKM